MVCAKALMQLRWPDVCSKSAIRPPARASFEGAPFASTGTSFGSSPVVQANGDGDAQPISQLCWMFFPKIIDDQDQELELMREGYRLPISEELQSRAWAADRSSGSCNQVSVNTSAQCGQSREARSRGGFVADARRAC